MSKNADVNAPTRLDIKGREELLSEPELVTMREQRQQVYIFMLINSTEGSPSM